jgi:hypothetical protein
VIILFAFLDSIESGKYNLIKFEAAQVRQITEVLIVKSIFFFNANVRNQDQH